MEAVGTFFSSIPKYAEQAWERVRPIVKQALRIALIALVVFGAIALFYLNPLIFSVSFLAGLAYHAEITPRLQQIYQVAFRHPVICAGIGIVACGAAWPVIIGLASVIYGLELGYYCQTGKNTWDTAPL